jgi:hypothetical protein
MKRLVTALVLVLAVLAGTRPATAQQTAVLRGIVVSEADGSPISGATVLVVGSTVTVKTDAGGLFSFKVKPGSYQVSANRMGFSSETIPAPSGKDLCIILKPLKK